MALLSTDADFYLRLGTTWVLSATATVAILKGWVRGPGFRPKKTHLIVLVYSLLLARDALRLRMLHRNIPESYQCRCSGAVNAPAAAECAVVEGGYIRDLVTRLADRCFLMMLLVCVALGNAVWSRRVPPRPRAPERVLGGVGVILAEIVAFLPCVMSCIYGLPVLLQDYIAAAAANGGGAAAA
ncbi:hypothetical protein BAE44_0013655 [Dichanthelium oligosanthes]|uniref:Uncharacterized protein n=1 Tax=Dichanthelium oligosanthes TaxID=888268 RepID=A0A1E5VJP1_9POAL|nr:hypothetical protein BAE44_0013655 [Dichanthelium oligosanthes]